MKLVFATVLAAALLGIVVAAAIVRGGLYDVSVTAQHTPPVYWLLQTVMHYSVKRRARAIEPPALGDEGLQQRGAEVYAANCVRCHGAPGVAPGEFANSMQPLPGPLVDALSRWLPRELYWITRNGIKMSGMPAWEYRLSDDDLWALVAFLVKLPQLSAQAYASLHLEPDAAPDRDDGSHRRAVPDAARGRVALHQHGCNACHVIPGVTGSDVHVGPPLAGIASRQLIAGAVPNTMEQMVRWLRNPDSVDKGTAMPALGVAPEDARDIAAYLATLH